MCLDGRFWLGFFAGLATVGAVLAVRRSVHGEDPERLLEDLSQKLAALESNLGIGAVTEMLADERSA
ncbi:MAG: hypothetical protein N2109_08115 [Fimbriimonadales bacterium]|nr:hypothetical protein [Fimbriimonadales bacterium]